VLQIQFQFPPHYLLPVNELRKPTLFNPGIFATIGEKLPLRVTMLVRNGILYRIYPSFKVL
jgi:hypothetical protein